MASQGILVCCIGVLFVLVVVEPCPPQYAPLLPCADFNWDTRYAEDPRSNGLECFLQHVTKGRPTDSIATVKAVEHATVTRSCHPLGTSFKYRYHTRIHPQPRSHRWIRQIPSPTYHWTKNGQILASGDEEIVLHHVSLGDEGVYACTYMEHCMYQSKHNGFCYYKPGTIFRLSVSTKRVKEPGLMNSNFTATTTNEPNSLQPALPESPDFALPRPSSASHMTTLSTAALLTVLTMQSVLSAEQAVVPGLSPVKSAAENDPASVNNSSTVLEVLDETQPLLTETEEDHTDAPYAPRFHYPEECPACTANCPCDPYQRKRKHILE